MPISSFNSPIFFHRLILLSRLRIAVSLTLSELRKNRVFRRRECQPTPIWRAWVSLFLRDLAQNLSNIDDPTSSYATGGIPFELTGARKLPHPVKFAFDKAEIQSRSSFYRTQRFSSVYQFWNHITSFRLFICYFFLNNLATICSRIFHSLLAFP